jgi:addiction module HigA family antidote
MIQGIKYIQAVLGIGLKRGRYKMASVNNLPTIGEVLALEFLEPMNISQNALAKALGIPQNRLSDIINGKRGVSADTDLRLCKYFGLTDGYFSGLQMDFERIAAKRKLQKELDKIKPLKAVSAVGA